MYQCDLSVGENNCYHHPNKEVLDNLTDSKIYRTDKNDSIMFKIKNNSKTIGINYKILNIILII